MSDLPECERCGRHHVQWLVQSDTCSLDALTTALDFYALDLAHEEALRIETERVMEQTGLLYCERCEEHDRLREAPKQPRPAHRPRLLPGPQRCPAKYPLTTVLGNATFYAMSDIAILVLTGIVIAQQVRIMHLKDEIRDLRSVLRRSWAAPQS